MNVDLNTELSVLGNMDFKVPKQLFRVGKFICNIRGCFSILSVPSVLDSVQK